MAFCGAGFQQPFLAGVTGTPFVTPLAVPGNGVRTPLIAGVTGTPFAPLAVPGNGVGTSLIAGASPFHHHHGHHHTGVDDPCTTGPTNADCTRIVQGARTVNVPCTQNVCRTVQIPTHTRVTRYRTEPRVHNYTTYETRTRPKIIQQPRTYNETRTVHEHSTVMVPRTITVPRQITVPRTTFVNVTKEERFTVPVTRHRTHHVTIPYQVTIPGVRTGRRCGQKTTIVQRTVPTFNVVANQPKPIHTGLQYLDGQSHHHDQVTTSQVVGTTNLHHDHLPATQDYLPAAHDHYPTMHDHHISNSPDLNADGIVTGQEAAAYGAGVRRVDAVHHGGYYGGGGVAYDNASVGVVNPYATDLNNDGVTTPEEALLYSAGARRVDPLI